MTNETPDHILFGSYAARGWWMRGERVVKPVVCRPGLEDCNSMWTKIGKFFQRNLFKLAGGLIRRISEHDGKPGISAEDLRQTYQWVVEAERNTRLPDGTSRSQWVKKKVMGGSPCLGSLSCGASGRPCGRACCEERANPPLQNPMNNLRQVLLFLLAAISLLLTPTGCTSTRHVRDDLTGRLHEWEETSYPAIAIAFHTGMIWFGMGVRTDSTSAVPTEPPPISSLPLSAKQLRALQGK